MMDVIWTLEDGQLNDGVAIVLYSLLPCFLFPTTFLTFSSLLLNFPKKNIKQNENFYPTTLVGYGLDRFDLS